MMNPGTSAPAKRSPTEIGSGVKLPFLSCAAWFTPARMSPMKMSTVDGGMSCAIVDEAQMVPAISRLS